MKNVKKHIKVDVITFDDTPNPDTLFKRASVCRGAGLHDAAHACEQLAFSKMHNMGAK